MFSKVSSLLLFIVLAVFVAPNYSNAETKTVIIYGDTGDGEVTTAPYPGTWSLQHSRLVGREANYTNDHFRVLSGSFYTPTNYLGIVRAFLTFDTSVIPTEATIVDAKINLFATRKLDDFNDELAYVSLLQGFQQSTSSIVNSDVTLCGDTLVDPKKLSGDVDISDIELSKYQEFVLNGDGIDWINKDGYTKLCLREGHDIENIETVKNENTGTWYESTVIFKSSESQDLSNRPYLEIRYNVPSDQNPYPLYTQIESPYPSVEETAGWEDDKFAKTENETALKGCETIAKCGCAITSIVMMSRANGVTEGVDGEDVNPGTLNSWLVQNEGYNNYGGVIWAKALKYFGRETENGKIETPFSLKDFKTESESEVIESLNDETLEVVTYSNKVRGGHYLLLTSYLSSDNTFGVRDPWYFDTSTLNDSPVSEKTFDYDNDWNHSNIFLVEEPKVTVGYLDISLGSPAELKLIDDSGNVTGYVDGVVLEDIKGSGYSQQDTIGDPAAQDDYSTPDHYPKRLIVTEAHGEYELQVIGTASGEYTLEVYFADQYG